MKTLFQVFIFILAQHIWAQVDYSENWEDFFSYNNVKDFIKVDNDIYAIVDNAIFKYNINSGEIDKISSVNGLSGENTSSIFYSKAYDKIIIGYKTGLIEIIDKNGDITIAKDIVNYIYSGSKQINDITEFENKLYLSTSFAIVVYDIENLQFGDTYFIGDLSSEISVNEIEVFEDTIYAATENGIFTANVFDPNLIDYNNWTQNFTGNFTSIEIFNNEIYTAQNRSLYTIEAGSLQLKKNLPQPIRNFKASIDYLSIATQRNVTVLDSILATVVNYTTKSTDEYYYNLNIAFYENDKLFLGTQEFGVLKSSIQNISSFEEFHPEGPISNLPFSINAKEGHLWVVYGGYDAAYAPRNRRYGYSHFNGNSWVNTKYSEINVRDLVNVTFDPQDINRVYISSWGGGMIIVENDVVNTHWTNLNSGLEWRYRINGSNFDDNGNLWIANAWVDNRVKKYSVDEEWSSGDMSSVLINPAWGLNELEVDKITTVWIGSRRNGVLVYNENGDKKRALTTEVNNGSLPDLNARTVKVDSRSRLWIGTLKGLVVLYDALSIFDQNIVNAEPVIILDEGIPKKLLGDQSVNSIEIDGADNKWFGTETGGALQTNPDGTTTLQNFNKSNSPLPSNNILKIAVDDDSGLVYFATSKGIVAFDSNVSSYGENLTEVYAYPNPSTKYNELITIDGRYGSHLPKGTNIKIVDASGNLVYETNVKEGGGAYGGKVVWDKTNLAGRKVSSGIYIVLLTANENSETEVAKIAIIN